MANFNFNKVILGGRLVADPELKTTPSGISVTSFTVAVNRNYRSKDGSEPQADFLNCTAWRQTAEFITRYFRKASSICVVGSLQTRSWISQDGQKHYATEVVVDEAFFVDAKSEAPAAVQQMAGGTPFSAPANTTGTAPTTPYVPDAYAANGNSGAAPKFEDLSDDEELPF